MSRKPAGTASRDPEHHLRLFIEQMREYALLTLDADGHVRTWNAGARAIQGYEADEIIGRHVSLFYTPEDRAAGRPEHALRTAAAEGRFSDVGQRVRKDGSLFLADVVLTPIFEPNGGLLGFGKITRDISVPAAAADQLRASELRLQSLVDTVLDTLVDGLIIIDRRGRIQTYNRACERLFGYDVASVIGRNVRMLMPPEISREHDQYLRNYHETGVRKIIGISREVTGQRKDGSTFPMHLAVGETSHRGEPIYVGIIRDLTARNRTEDQLRQSQKMEAVGQLTGGIAHDFNNILMVVTANAEALLELKSLGSGARRRVQQISKATGRAAELTRQLLAFSRRQPLRPQPTNLNELVTATGNLLRRVLGETIQIKSSLAPDLWTVSADRAQLESALVNLALNARDAMPGGGRLLIETTNQQFDADDVVQYPDVAEGDFVMLAVCDNGIGIPRESLSRVFEPFFTTKAVGKGTGLGLSMVYGFIKQSNGVIRIYSEVGMGTTVRLYLPRTGAVPEAAPEPVAGEMPRGRERIIAVEDDPQVRDGVVEQLRSLGYTVFEANSGEAALAMLVAADAPFDLLLTDVVMPGRLGGKGLADEVARRWPQMAIVFMSGYSEDAITHEGRLDPGVRLLTKPFRKHDLATMVRKALDEGRS
jgi:PAS domain S-box-containing protein